MVSELAAIDHHITFSVHVFLSCHKFTLIVKILRSLSWLNMVGIEAVELCTF